MSAQSNVLVLGGTGFIGRAVCEMLVERGEGAGRVIVPTRRLLHGSTLRALPTMDLVQADVHDDAALRRLVAKAAAVISLVGILHGKPADFERIHVALPRRLAAACRDAGVRRIVHVSALGAAPDAPSHYLRSKAAGEAALAGAGLDVTLLRPSVVFGVGGGLMHLLAGLQRVLPVLPLGGADAQLQPVWVEDVACAAVRCLDRPETIGRTYELAGPEVLTLAEAARRAGRWIGAERRQIALPDWAARLQAAALSILPGEPLLSADNLASLKVPAVASGRLPGLDALGIRPTPLETLAEAENLNRRLDRWRAAARRA
jgi:uncharacterized protein YbjT (DUF2867 family)